MYYITAVQQDLLDTVLRNQKGKTWKKGRNTKIDLSLQINEFIKVDCQVK